MADPELIRQNLIDGIVRLLGRGEEHLAEKVIHPDYVNHEADPERARGPEGAIATSRWLRSCFGNLSYEVDRVLIEGDMAAAFVTMSGTHEGGPPPGAPATHKPFSVKHVHLVRFADDGRALEHWAVRDDLGLVRQVGLLPPLPSDAPPPDEG